MAGVNGKYVLDRRLGGGGMAEVYLARVVGAEGFSRQVAIKRVLPGFSDDARFASMFISEAQLTSRLQHSNVVSVLDFDRDADGRLFLVMELVNGTDLDALLATGPVDFSLVIYLAVEILRGLDYAHELPVQVGGMRGVVHRDMSPHNVLVGWDGAVKVSDFGIAKARAASSATGSIFVKGKPAYMSPEQARGAPLDGRSDLFAVGVMLFEMLCLQPLFAGDTTEETLSRVWFAEIPTVRDIRPEVPEDLSRIVSWLLTRDLAERAPSAAAVIAALVACRDYPRDGREQLITTMSQRFVGRAPVRTRNVSHASHSDPTLVPPSAVPARVHKRTRSVLPAHPEAPGRQGRRWLWALLAGVLAIGGIVGVLLARQGAPQPTSSKASAAPSQSASEASHGTPQTTKPPDEDQPTPSPDPATPPAMRDSASPAAALPAAKAAPTAPDRAPAPAPRPTPSRPPPAAPKADGIHEIRL